MKKHIPLCLVFSLLFFQRTFSQTATLLKDVNPGKENSNPYSMIKFSHGNNLFFAFQNDTTLGLLLTDGTAPNTRLVKSFDGAHDGEYKNLTKLGSEKAIFTASYYPPASQLWVTDGSDAGTYILKSFNEGGSPSTEPQIGPVVQGKVYMKVLIGNTDINDIWQLWITDGTPSGTTLLADSIDYRQSSRTYLSSSRVLNNNLIFYAFNPERNSYQIWRSDGTTSGTWLLRDFGHNIALTTMSMAVFNNTVLFSGTDDAHGTELWKTDGTVEGTKIVKDIQAGTLASNPSDLIVFKNKIYFLANDSTGITGAKAFWQSNGTSKGTVKVQMPSSLINTYSVLGQAGKKLYFVGLDDVKGERPWATDGTAAGTEIITDEYPGTGVGAGSSDEFVNIGGTAYFVLAIETYYPSWSLFKSDGRLAGTSEILHNPIETDDFTIFNLSNAGGILYFINFQKDKNGGQNLYSFDDVNGLQQYDFFPDQSDQAEILLATKTGVFLSLDGTDVGQEPYVFPSGNAPQKITDAPLFSTDIFNVYPNPSSGSVNIQSVNGLTENEEATIVIRDLWGRNVFEQKKYWDGEDVISLSLPDNFPNGLYLMNIETKKSSCKKLVELLR